MHKTLLPLLLVSLILFSCGRSEIRKKLSVADEVVITFSAKGKGIPKTFSASGSSAISRIIDFIEGKEDNAEPCTDNDGVILFNKDGKGINVIAFSYVDEGCRQFYFTMDGKTYKTKLNNEAVDFFTALAAGKNVYW